MVAEHDLFSIQTLTRLQTLELSMKSNGSWNLQTLDPLCSLTALESLDLFVEGLHPKPMLVTAALSRLSLLTKLYLHNNSPDLTDDPPCIYDSQRAGEVISSLVLLKHLALVCLIDSIPVLFSSLQHLENLMVTGSPEDWPDFTVPDSFSNCRKLTSLELQHFYASPERVDWKANCSVLARLPALSRIRFECVDLADIQAESWAFSNNLTHLYISVSGLQEIPRALVSLTSLQELELSYIDHLADLPAGPYLERLTHLHLLHCNFDAMPVALARATSLKELHCRTDDSWVDADRLKALLPQRCQLRLHRC